MMKKNLKHGVAVLLLVGFVVLAMGSTESSPSYYSSGDSSYGTSGGSSSSSQSTYLVTIYYKHYYNDYNREQYENKTFPYNIKASSGQEAIDEAVYQFVRSFPEPRYSITDYMAVKLY